LDLDLAQLTQLLDVLIEKDIAEFEHEAEGVRVRVVRGKLVQTVAPHDTVPPPAPATGGTAPPPSLDAPSDSVDVTSPFVGTFYRSPSPDTPSFVDVGSVVRPGQTLCIVEAMKLMNEIDAECSGTVTEIFAQNGKSVEFGQKLFRIKKA
jgi:acetyl-CoA carboxylase biotin carboxyl carrier protein